VAGYGVVYERIFESVRAGITWVSGKTCGRNSMSSVKDYQQDLLAKAMMKERENSMVRTPEYVSGTLQTPCGGVWQGTKLIYECKSDYLCPWCESLRRSRWQLAKKIKDLERADADIARDSDIDELIMKLEREVKAEQEANDVIHEKVRVFALDVYDWINELRREA
jgi:hypothetical protein